MKILDRSPHKLAKTHVLHNPIFDPGEFASYLGPDQCKKALKGSPQPNIWITFDRNGYGNAQNSLMQMTEATYNFFKSIEHDPILSLQITINDITSHDLCEYAAQVKDREPSIQPVYCLCPSKYYKVYITEFIVGTRLPNYAASVSAPGQYRWALVSTVEEEDTPRRIANAAAGIQPVMHGSEHLGSSLKDTASTAASDRTGQTRTAAKPKAQGATLALDNRERPLHEEEVAEMDELMELSKNEFEDEYGQEELQFQEALEASKLTYAEEEADERLVEIRRRPHAQIDETQEAQQWQTAAERSWEEIQIRAPENTDDRAFERALESSRRAAERMQQLPAPGSSDEMELVLKMSEQSFQAEGIRRKGSATQAALPAPRRGSRSSTDT